MGKQQYSVKVGLGVVAKVGLKLSVVFAIQTRKPS